MAQAEKEQNQHNLEGQTQAPSNPNQQKEAEKPQVPIFPIRITHGRAEMLIADDSVNINYLFVETRRFSLATYRREYSDEGPQEGHIPRIIPCPYPDDTLAPIAASYLHSIQASLTEAQALPNPDTGRIADLTRALAYATDIAIDMRDSLFETAQIATHNSELLNIVLPKAPVSVAQ